MKSINTLKDNGLNLVLSMIVIILIAGVVIVWVYNFLALSDDKLFDEQNKYIDPTISNPDIDTNYKDTYNNKNKLDIIIMNILNWFNSLKKIYIILFLGILLFGLIFNYRNLILKNMKNMFN